VELGILPSHVKSVSEPMTILTIRAKVLFHTELIVSNLILIDTTPTTT